MTGARRATTRWTAWLVAAGAATLLVACTTPLQRGEALYQQGDRRGALEVWRQVPADSHDRAAAEQRIAQVEDEQAKLLTRYRQRGRYFERKGRLAESILSYRVVLKLDSSDAETLARVQELSRRLAEEKAGLDAAARAALAAGELKEARAQAAALRQLDPFDPAAERVERDVDQALDAEIERLLANGRRGFTAGDYPRASEQFQAVLALDPENESAQGYLSYMAAIRSEEEAIRTAERAAQIPRTARGSRRPEPIQLRASEAEIRAEGFHQNALAAERAGDLLGAIGQDQRALAVDPGHARARAHVAELRGKLAADVPAWIEAGRAAFAQEDLQTALDQWRRVLLVDPGNEKALQYVARAEQLLQNLEQLRAEPEPPRAVGVQR